MSEIKHTPGEWRIKYGDLSGLPRSIYVEGEYQIAELLSPANEFVADRLKHDARLIAAAPELFAALEEIVNTPWIGGKGGLVKARAALAKARGE